MPEIQKTNICCLDLTQDCIDFLKSLDLNVYEGSLGSVFSIKWSKSDFGAKTVLVDVDYPDNLQEYHVFIHDMMNPHQREYINEEHQIKEIESGERRHLECHHPVNTYDLRPYGLVRLYNHLRSLKNHRRIEIIFIGDEHCVEYYSNAISIHDPRSLGQVSNIDGWNLITGAEKYGKRVKLSENGISKILFEGRLNKVKYYRVFSQPTVYKGENLVPDEDYIPLLTNEEGEWVSYICYPSDDYVKVILPQVEDKAALLKNLFENVLFKYFSDYFPDVEARNWIYKDTYKVSDELEIQRRIDAKHQEYEQVIAELEREAQSIQEKNLPLKQLLTESGSNLVKAVKFFLEWLGFENVTDKDDTLAEGDLKEEDLCFEFDGNHILMEVKGINGTSTDSECSQVDKIVNRRMRELKTTDVHGVYVVNHQRNIEPLKRQAPPFNKNQIKDAENQSRTLVYTMQLFALHSDIENGYISKEQARRDLMQVGLAAFHNSLTSLGVPYKYYKENKVICLDLQDVQISVGDLLFYEDDLQRLVGLKIESLQSEKQDFQTFYKGKVGIKVDKKVPRDKEIFVASPIQ